MSSSLDFDRRDRADDFLCGDNGAGVVWDIDVEGDMHHLVRVIRRRILIDGDLITELGGIAHSRFDPGMPDESKSVLAKPLEHQCSCATISPGAGTNSARNSPPHVPYSKLLCCHVAR